MKGAFYHQLGISELSGCLKKKFSQIGLESIKTDYVSLPICWGGFIGKTLYEDLLALLRYIGPLLYDDLGIAGDDEKDQYEKLVDNAFDECVEYQTYLDVHWTIGRKHDSD